MPCLLPHFFPSTELETLLVLATVTFRGVRRNSNFTQVGNDYTYGQKHRLILRFPAGIQIPAHQNLLGSSMTKRRLCHRSAVFFRQLLLIALSFPREQMQLAFRKILLFFFFIFSNGLHLKFLNLKYGQAVNIPTECIFQ